MFGEVALVVVAVTVVYYNKLLQQGGFSCIVGQLQPVIVRFEAKQKH